MVLAAPDTRVMKPRASRVFTVFADGARVVVDISGVSRSETIRILRGLLKKGVTRGK
jgi:hypothetical protein